MSNRWLFKMARWAQNPPPMKRVIFVGGILALCLVLAAIETFVGWPDALSLDPKGDRFKP